MPSSASGSILSSRGTSPGEIGVGHTSAPCSGAAKASAMARPAPMAA
jgi:hypothetical protein